MTATPAAKWEYPASEEWAEANPIEEKVAGPPDETSASAAVSLDCHCSQAHPSLYPDIAFHDQQGKMALFHELLRI